MNNFFTIFFIKLLCKIAPKRAYTLMKQKLLTPVPTHAKWPKEVRRIVFKTKYGMVRTYQYGEGKCIWLVHGWADAHQFWPLMQKLSKQGYCCIAMEFLPRGHMENKFVSLPKWTNVFDVAARSVPEPTHVLAHGLGASIIGNSKWLEKYDGELSLVSPMLDFYKGLEKFLRKQEIPLSLLKKLKDEVYFTDKVKLEALSATSSINQFNGRLSIFYSKSDDTSTVADIRKISERSNRKIVQFKGANSEKIINSRSLQTTIKQESKKLDIAV